MVIVNSTIDTLKKVPRLRDRTDRACFNRLLQHPARKRSRSILTTPESALGGKPANESEGRHIVYDHSQSYTAYCLAAAIHSTSLSVLTATFLG